ncbi:toprim domain-containing protein [Jeotgalicoccus sp. WY2]|uniref:toprim domain-containing protein n=1 Tax=Jeotgalicoccus sp. WY2 TaxID=2708346 RepID=UPI001BD4DAD8|nr:toprim domain-containing protein [Jeotgalicoccus sp. WY2]
MTKVRHIVATMGTELSQENLNLLERLSSNVTIMFDGDSAGRNATLKVGDTLLKRGLNVYVQKIPDKMDPDEILKRLVQRYLNSLFRTSSSIICTLKQKSCATTRKRTT